MDFTVWIARQLPGISLVSANNVIKLASEGSTVAFIARYRKEQTGNMDEVMIQKVIDAKEELEATLKRQAYILGEIKEQKKLTPELEKVIASTFDLDRLEEIYLPFKQKRKTKAMQAKEAGLEPFALWIWGCAQGTIKADGVALEVKAQEFLNPAAEITDIKTVLEKTQDILIEMFSLNQGLRNFVRDATVKTGFIRTAKGKKALPASKFERYFEYSESIASLSKPENSHRYLACRRGWTEEELTLNIDAGPDGDKLHTDNLARFEREAIKVPGTPGEPVLKRAALLAYKAYVFTSIENEVNKNLKKIADEAAIKVFAENLRKLLLAAPFGSKMVLGVDPGIRTGCKLALVADSGEYMASTVIHLQSPGERAQAQTVLGEVVKNAQLRAVAVGNGTAGREAETFVREAFKKLGVNVPVVMVSEAGASVYSASEVAREEFPTLDITVRGAISIARRLQDPLSELVKVDPKAIGVGQYQHDVSQTELKKSLEFVVDSCVNSVGVNLNSASAFLLARVSGISATVAKAIVDHRTKKGLFKARSELLNVSRFSEKVFEQSAGFLRIPGAENPLDNTGVHPERYGALENAAKRMGKKVAELVGSGVSALKADKVLANELGALTFADVVNELEKPGRDPREEFQTFQYREDIHEVRDLKPNMTCPGIVTNVTNFGAFVDIGVHQDGLVHISQLADHFVKDPREVVSPGDKVQVRVIEVNLEKNQIALTMKREGVATAGAPAAGASRGSGPGGPPRGGRGAPMPPPPKMQELKNNAFAGLANLKLKK
ncbi:MAG: helix-hairpin-helix domain-containing protein [Bdellovibrionota bacterium]